MSNNWPTQTLGDLFAIGAGKTMSAAARGGGEKTPFLRTSNVLWDEIDLSTVDEMLIPARELDEKRLLPGDMLVCEGGEIGRAAIWNGEAEVMSFQNHLHRLRPISAAVEPRFFVYFLQAGFTQLGLFEGAGNRTTIPNLSRSRLAALEVPVPEVGEQRAIARALSSVRGAIKAHDRSGVIAAELKRAAMQKLFTGGLRGEEQNETEVGSIPQSWEVAGIGDIALSTQYGLSLRGHAIGAYPILRMNCQEDGAVRYRNLQFVDLNERDFETYRLRPGDLLFNRTNSIELVGRTAIVSEDRPAVFASYLVRLVVDERRCIPTYLNYFMNWPATQGEIKKLASRAVGQANINASKLRTVRIPLAPLAEQHEIVSTLEAIDRKIALHRTKRSVLDDLFKALLHRLMTGEIRVADLNLSALASMPRTVAGT